MGLGNVSRHVFFIGVFQAKEGRIGALVQSVVMFMENVFLNKEK
jgi:hypothetical protein